MRCTRQDSINGADECQERRVLFMATTKKRMNQEVLGGNIIIIMRINSAMSSKQRFIVGIDF